MSVDNNWQWRHNIVSQPVITAQGCCLGRGKQKEMHCAGMATGPIESSHSVKGFHFCTFTPRLAIMEHVISDQPGENKTRLLSNVGNFT